MRHAFRRDGYGEEWRCSACGLGRDHPNHERAQAIEVAGVRVIGPCAWCNSEMGDRDDAPMWSVERGAFVCRPCGEAEREANYPAPLLVA